MNQTEATSQKTFEKLNQALDSGAFVDVRRMLNGLPAGDVAHLLESSPPKFRHILWKMMEPENEGEVLNELSRGEGFDFHFEAAGVPELAIPEMEKALAINAKMVQVGRAAQRVPMYLESFQVRRSQAFGAQGHSGHENFPNVIRLVASGRLDLSPIITAHYNLADTVAAIAKSIQRTDGKIMVHPN